MEFGQEHRLNMDRMMHQGAGEHEYVKCFFPWIPFNPIFLALEFNKSRSMLMKTLPKAMGLYGVIKREIGKKLLSMKTL